VDAQCREKYDHRNRRRYFLLLCAFVYVDAREKDTEGVALVGRSEGFHQIRPLLVVVATWPGLVKKLSKTNL
jgi:hypothetical protein